jgi:protein SCO1
MLRWPRGLASILCATLVAACSGAGGAPDFTLRDDGGHFWELSQQHGKAVLLTFGFTHCTDTCPATLAKLIRLISSLPGDAREVEIAFVTVDPARDTVPVMHRFVARFVQPGGVLVGLTGTPAQIERVKAAYQVWSQPVRRTRTGDYDVAHTAVIFLIDPRGRIRAVRNDDDSARSLARAVAAMLAS